MEVNYNELMRYEKNKHKLKQLKLRSAVGPYGISVCDRAGGTLLRQVSIQDFNLFCYGLTYAFEHKKNNLTERLRKGAIKQLEKQNGIGAR